MRRRVVAHLAVGALLLSACGGPDAAPEATGSPEPEGTPRSTESVELEETEATETEAAAADGGTLVVAISSDPGHLNPAITTQGGTHTASEIIYNGLISLDDELNPEPDLAESWEVTDEAFRRVT